MRIENLQGTETGRLVNRDRQLLATALDQAQSLNPLSAASFDFSSIRPSGARLSSGASDSAGSLLDKLDFTELEKVIVTGHFGQGSQQLLNRGIYQDFSNVGPEPTGLHHNGDHFQIRGTPSR